MQLRAFYCGIFCTTLYLFALSKASKCGGMLSANSSGIINTPNYPSPYGLNQCKWIIKAPTGYNVRLEFLDFNVESEQENVCDTDSVQIRSGDRKDSPLLGNILCGQSTPEIVTSAGNTMSVTFSVSELSLGESRGFQAQYSKVKSNGTGSCLSSACGGTYENFTSCDIQSPGYPSSYSSNLNCTWLIKAPHPNQIISVEFLQLNLNEVNSACRMNNVTFYDISSNKLSVISESVCDMDLNRLKNKKIRSKGSKMLIKFRTKKSSESYGIQGFHLKFQAIVLPPPAGAISNLNKVSPRSTTTTTKKSTTTTTTSTASTTTTTTTTTFRKSPTASSTVSTATLKNVAKASSTIYPSESDKKPKKEDEKDQNITNSATTTSKTAAADLTETSPAAMSGLVVGILVVIAIIALVILLMVAFLHWKKRNSRIARRLREEDARSDANTLLSSIDSREFKEENKKKQNQINGHVIVERQEKFSYETDGLL